MTKRRTIAKDAPIPPRGKARDEGWATKVATAKKARSEAIRARKGKPATFADRMVVNSGRR